MKSFNTIFTLFFLMFSIVTSCKGANKIGGQLPEKGPDKNSVAFFCEYSLQGKSDEDLLKSGRNLALAGVDFVKIFEHSKNCIN